MINLNLNDLTLGDIETLEDIAGADALQALLSGNPGGKLLVALAFIAKRKDDPAFTLEQARSLPLTAFELESDLPKDDVSG